VLLASVSDVQAIPTSLYWSPDGQQLAFFSSEPLSAYGSLYVKALDSYPMQALSEPNDIKWSMAWSPDGKQIAFQSAVGLGADLESSFLEIDTQKFSLADEASIIGAAQPIWSPDGRWLAATAIHQTQLQLVLFPKGDWTKTPAVARPAGILSPSLAWSPDSHWLIYSVAGPELNDGFVLYALDVNTNTQRILSDEPGYLASLVWSPDARWLAMVSRSVGFWTLSLLDVTCLQTGKQCEITPAALIGDVQSAGAVSWSPDSRWLLYSTNNRVTGIPEVWMAPADCVSDPASCRRRAVRLVDAGEYAAWQPGTS
jgi:Tol biopolymer transport system component